MRTTALPNDSLEADASAWQETSRPGAAGRPAAVERLQALQQHCLLVLCRAWVSDSLSLDVGKLRERVFLRFSL